MARRDYTPEDTDTALTVLVYLGGNSTKAANHLKQSGLPVSEQTLRRWKTVHADRLAQIQEREAPELAKRIASRSEAVAIQILDVEEKLIRKLDDGLDGMKPGEVAQALKNVTTSKALQFDRISNPVRGRPNVRVEHLDAGQALLELGRRLGIAVDSTATEEPPGTLTA